jgi:hypothetical protein
VGGPVSGRFHHYPPPIDRFSETFGGVVGVGLDTDPTQQHVQLAGGHAGSPVDDQVDHFLGGFFGEVGGARDDHPGPAEIDLTRSQRLPHPGKPILQI